VPWKFRAPDPGCIYNKSLYYKFMEKYKNGEEVIREEFQKERINSIKEVV